MTHDVFVVVLFDRHKEVALYCNSFNRVFPLSTLPHASPRLQLARAKWLLFPSSLHFWIDSNYHFCFCLLLKKTNDCTSSLKFLKMAFKFLLFVVVLACASMQAHAQNATCKHVANLFQSRADLLKTALEKFADTEYLYQITNLAEKLTSLQNQGIPMDVNGCKIYDESGTVIVSYLEICPSGTGTCEAWAIYRAADLASGFQACTVVETCDQSPHFNADCTGISTDFPDCRLTCLGEDNYLSGGGVESCTAMSAIADPTPAPAAAAPTDGEATNGTPSDTDTSGSTVAGTALAMMMTLAAAAAMA
jgi:hypothetical protein